MPGITKQRKICHLPESTVFYPEHPSRETASLTFDELEALRLSDLEDKDQDEAAELMEISRATYQRILHAAHKSIADALINGKTIEIKGGKYVVAQNPCDNDTVCLNCRFKDEEAHPEPEQTQNRSEDKNE